MNLQSSSAIIFLVIRVILRWANRQVDYVLSVFEKINPQILADINKWLDKHNIDKVNIPTDHLAYEK